LELDPVARAEKSVEGYVALRLTSIGGCVIDASLGCGIPSDVLRDIVLELGYDETGYCGGISSVLTTWERVLLSALA
jgi:hypothetical protein